jgi:chromosome segregation ATPase
MANKAVLSQNVELKEKLGETVNNLLLMKDEHLRIRKEAEEKNQIIEKLNTDVIIFNQKAGLMGELLQLRELYEQSRTNQEKLMASKLKEASNNLSSQVESLGAEVSSLKDQLAAKEIDHNQAKVKREAIIRDLKRENGSLAEQFIQANTDRNWLKSEIERLKEEAWKRENFSQSNTQKTKELAEKKDKAEKELYEALERIAGLEEEINDIKSKKLPEKEKVVCNHLSKSKNTVIQSQN